MKNLELAQLSLKGLSIGDAFGDSFFGETDFVWEHIENQTIPATSKWEFTDDTVMAIAVLDNLRHYGKIQQNALAQQFAQNYLLDMNRGYGGTAHKTLREISEGKNWQEVSTQLFDGQGSMGNGAAMRVAPLGAYFYQQDNNFVIEQAQEWAVIHANSEAQVGAVAIALAAKLAIQQKESNTYLSANEFIKQIYVQLEPSDTQSKIGKSLDIPKSYRIDTITSILGNGSKLLAQDTVPFALWCAAHYLDDFEAALWRAVSGLGDRDTIGAMVGSIVILSAPESTVPPLWLELVEKVENSPFGNKENL